MTFLQSLPLCWTGSGSRQMERTWSTLCCTQPEELDLFCLECLHLLASSNVGNTRWGISKSRERQEPVFLCHLVSAHFFSTLFCLQRPNRDTQLHFLQLQARPLEKTKNSRFWEFLVRSCELRGASDFLADLQYSFRIKEGSS